jgi:glutamate-1-semialdehyde 2,1-aminomutase
VDSRVGKFLILNMDYQNRLLSAIPGGAHTYSRGFDQFPSNAPQILDRGKGAYVYDSHGRRYLDYGMALRAVTIGYAEDEVDNAAIEEIRRGNNLTRPSMIELRAAEKLIELIDSVEMVKFTKNGSTAVTAAVKLARAFTGRDFVARCAEHPFFSFDDWFIGSTVIPRGTTAENREQTKSFHYNNLESLERLVGDFPNKFACVVLEAATTEDPAPGFLEGVQKLCHQNGIVFILDEMITGFRWDLKGAQHKYGIQPDLSTFGKSMANGYSLACVGGRRDIMQLGSIEFEGAERVFLLSSTHGAEMSSLGAFIATTNYLENNQVVEHLYKYGAELKRILKALSIDYELESNFIVGGPDCSPYFQLLDKSGTVSLELRTLFVQEMIKNDVLMPWIALCHRHGDTELEITREAADKSFRVIRKAIDGGIERYLEGPSIKPVFRKFN